MDIDLFLSPNGECGLLCNSEFSELPMGVIFDAETMELTAEFMEADPFHFNITVEESLRDQILLAKRLYVGCLREGLIADTIEVPLLYLNDPYGSDFNQQDMGKPQKSMVEFEHFMRRSTSAQPVHREDLSNEDSRGSVLKGMDPKQLEFVPQLIRQRMLEAGPKGPSGPQGPQMQGPRPTGPMGPGGAPGAPKMPTPRPKPPTDGKKD